MEDGCRGLPLPQPVPRLTHRTRPRDPGQILVTQGKSRNPAMSPHTGLQAPVTLNRSVEDRGHNFNMGTKKI